MDVDAVRRYAGTVWEAKQGEMVTLMIEIGDRLGLFTAMAADGGPMSPHDLAAATGLHERPVREWLYGVAAADLVEHDGGRFRLPEEGRLVLVDEERSLFFSAGFFRGSFPESLIDVIEGLMRTGRGADYDALGDDAAMAMERLSGPFNRLALVPMVLPQLGGMVDRLTGGGSAVDVGGGSGTAGEAIARAFPAAEVTVLDPSTRALARGRARADDLPNLRFERGIAERLEGGPYDLLMALDCLHDMPRPDLALGAMANHLAPGGAVLVKELKSSGDFDLDKEKNPLLAMAYGLSLSACLLSGASTEDGLALGNQALNPARLQAMAADQGLSSMGRLEVPDPANHYFVLTA